MFEKSPSIVLRPDIFPVPLIIRGIHRFCNNGMRNCQETVKFWFTAKAVIEVIRLLHS
jgi:hypothetical protein